MQKIYQQIIEAFILRNPIAMENSNAQLITIVQQIRGVIACRRRLEQYAKEISDRSDFSRKISEYENVNHGDAKYSRCDQKLCEYRY